MAPQAITTSAGDIKPTIRDGKLVSVEFSGVNLPLMTPAPLDELQDVIDAATRFSSYFDLSKLGAQQEGDDFPHWAPGQLTSFVASASDLRDDQAEALLILAESKDMVSKDFIAAVEKRTGRKNLSNMQLAGLLAGITVKSHSYARQSPFSIQWFRTDDGWDRRYTLADEAYEEPIKAGAARRESR